MIFGDTEGLTLFRETIMKCCSDCEEIILDAWNRHHESPGDWRELITHVRDLNGGGGGDEPPTPSASVQPCKPGDVMLVRASDVKIKKYDWLWESYLVRGKFHVVAGKPSGGKTTLMMSLAAIASSGGLWPDGTRAEEVEVLIWSGEDDPDDTLAPRLKAMGANLANIHFISAVKDAITLKDRPFDPAQDLEALKRAVKKIGNVGLIIVDPIVSAVGGDSHKNAEVRRALQPLVDLATECNAALVGISHFTKGTGGQDPIERVTGSLAFGAIARVVFAVAKTKDEESGVEERIFVRAKSNIGPSDGGFKFSIGQAHLPADGMYASVVTWGESLEGSARDLLKEAEGAGDSTKREDAQELIQETIRAKGGEASAVDVRAALKGAGIGRDSGYRAINGLLERHQIARVRYVENGPWTYIFPRRGGVADVSAFDPAASDSGATGDLV
jgi:putative DNA primase/helicase